jgi:hypothetical protein
MNARFQIDTPMFGVANASFHLIVLPNYELKFGVRKSRVKEFDEEAGTKWHKRIERKWRKEKTRAHFQKRSAAHGEEVLRDFTFRNPVAKASLHLGN